jgi:FAD/FMN-containing dehydrogenase
VVGATLGGGIGSLHGHRGLLVDFLDEVEVVTASGDLIKASESQNADLFWALRGAGSNFGIVTSATYRLPKVSNNGKYVNADYVYPVSTNQSFFEVMEKFDETLPSRLSITGASFFDRINNKVSNPERNVQLHDWIFNFGTASYHCERCFLRLT